MEYVVLALVALGAVALLCVWGYLKTSRPSDYEAINDLVAGRGLRTVSVSRDDAYWRYWLRGRLLLSNCARVYVVVAEAPGGARQEIHVAFDQWPPSTGGVQVLLERDLPAVGSQTDPG
jgi:hypothetical protein